MIAAAAVGALLAAAVIGVVYDLEAGVVTALVLLPVGVASAAASRLALRRRTRLGSLRRQALVVGVLAFGPLAVALPIAVERMFVSAHDALFTLLVAAYAVLLGLLAGRRLLAEVMADADRERAATEAARRSLVASISHDLRTPVTSLRLLVDALDDDVGDDAARRDYVRRLGVHVRALGGLIDDLFELSRLEAGQIAWTLEQVPVGELLEETVEAMRPQATACGVAVRAEVPPGLGATRGDPEGLQRVLFNLIQNAIRHTPADGSVVVRAEPAGSGVRVEVADTGAGFAPEDRERVFAAFAQGADRAARSDGGAGLGLAIARAIVEAHGGRIWIAEGDEESGGRVRFELPATA